MSERPHLCFVSSEIAPGTSGGIGRLVATTAQALHATGWRVSLILDVAPEALVTFRRFIAEHGAEIKVYAVADLVLPDEQRRQGSYFELYHRSEHIAAALAQLHSTDPLNGVEFHEFLGLAYHTLRSRWQLRTGLGNVPVWVRLHGSLELWEQANCSPPTSWQQHLFAMERFCLRWADGWICPSQDIGKWYTQVYDLEAQFLVAPPPFERLGPGKAHPRVLGSPPYRLLYYSKLEHLKGTDILVRAALQLCEQFDLPLSIELVGASSTRMGRSYQHDLEALIPPRWRERFVFHGPIDPQQLPDLACACTLAVVPSRVETFCLAAHELNWIGIPLVLNDLPAFRSFFRDGRDCRVFDGSPDGLARVLEDLLTLQRPFAGWEWNAASVLDAAEPSTIYAKALQHFQPRVMQGGYSPVWAVHSERSARPALGQLLGQLLRWIGVNQIGTVLHVTAGTSAPISLGDVPIERRVELRVNAFDQQLPLPDLNGSLDVVVCDAEVQASVVSDALLFELRRVLRAAGHLLLFVHGYDDEVDWQQLFERWGFVSLLALSDIPGNTQRLFCLRCKVVDNYRPVTQ